jgi:hypothetical protein
LSSRVTEVVAVRRSLNTHDVDLHGFEPAFTHAVRGRHHREVHIVLRCHVRVVVLQLLEVLPDADAQLDHVRRLQQLLQPLRHVSKYVVVRILSMPQGNPPPVSIMSIVRGDASLLMVALSPS